MNEKMNKNVSLNGNRMCVVKARKIEAIYNSHPLYLDSNP